MNIQKPTVLDAARIAAELEQLMPAIIECAYANPVLTALGLLLRYPRLMLTFSIQKRHAFIAAVKSVPEDFRKLNVSLSGCVMTGARQVSGDRIVSIELQKEDRLGRKHDLTFILEMIPNFGNAYLVDASNSVKWSLKRKNIESYKPPPPLKKPTILNLGSVELNSIDGELREKIYGLNERDIFNLELTEDYVPNAIEAIKRYADNAIKPGPAWIIFDGPAAVGFSLVRPRLEPNETAKMYDSALIMYGEYYSLATRQFSTEEKLDSLNAVLSSAISKAEKKHDAIMAELQKAEAADTLRLKGELLLANIDAISKGSAHARLRNFEGSSPAYVDIDLDPAKSVTANAEEYFKKYKKARSSLKTLPRRLKDAEEVLSHLQLVRKDSGSDPDKLEEALRRLKLLSESTVRKARKVVPPRQPFKRFFASNGWEILVGRTNADNDELTFKIASKDDYWFHAWQAAGSHVVLRLPNRQAIPDKKILLEAASLAAHFSKARTSSKVPVAYTQVKFVRKPKKFPPKRRWGTKFASWRTTTRRARS